MNTAAVENETPEERAERGRYEIRSNPDHHLCRLIAPFVVMKGGSPVWCCKSEYHKTPHSGLVGNLKTAWGERPLRFRWPGEGPRRGERFPDALSFRRRGEPV